MPANDGRHARKSHRALTKTISATAAAIITLALAACTTASGTGTSSAGLASSPAVRLTGSGSTFDAPFFDLAFARYQQQNPGVAISYSSVGSSAGIAAFSAKQADFGASDVPMTAAEQAAAHGGASVQVPVDLGAEAAAIGYVPLPPRIQQLARTMLQQITGPSGTHLLS